MLASLAAGATGIEVKDVLATMPDSLMPLISQSGRQDLIDFYESGVLGWTTNRLGGTGRTLYFDSDRVTVMPSGESSLDIILLPLKKGGKLVCVIKSVQMGEFRDSRISFYSPRWEPLQTERFIVLPGFDDFLEPSALKNDSVGALRAMSLLRFVSIAPTAGGSCGLEFAYTSFGNLGPDAEPYRHFMKKAPLRYVWNGRRFKLQSGKK